MPRTISIVTGDGISVPLVICALTLPDGATGVSAEGVIQAVGGSRVAIDMGAGPSAPAVPGSGSTFWVLYANNVSGLAAVATSSSAYPVPPAGNTTIYRGKLDFAVDAGPAADIDSNMPGSW